MDDADLIRRFTADGDAGAFAALVDRHRRRVGAIVASISGAADDDVVQDVFIKCAATLHSFRFECAFSTWLYRLAFNLAIDARRSAHKRRERERRYAEATRATAPKGDEALRDAVERLPDVYRLAVRAHYWLGYTTAEIGEMLGVAEGTVKSYLFRARAMIGEKLR